MSALVVCQNTRESPVCPDPGRVHVTEQRLLMRTGRTVSSLHAYTTSRRMEFAAMPRVIDTMEERFVFDSAVASAVAISRTQDLIPRR